MKEFISTIIVIAFILLVVIGSYNRGYDHAMKKVPTAMDVYQGKTTLQYTIVDGAKVDSVVVFKKN